jgi:BASS family bile acid:Na+ symporter
MNGTLVIISRLAMLVFLLTSMLEAGLSLTLKQILVPLKNARLVLMALTANFVVVPLAAVGIVKLFRLEEPFATGLVLFGLAAGAPFLPKLVELAEGDLAFSVGFMTLLMAGTVISLPLGLAALLPEVKVGIWQIARPLLLLMILPIVAGLLCKAHFESIAVWLRPGLGAVANVTLLVVLVLVVGLNLPSVFKLFGTRALAASLLFVGVALGTGYVFGGPDISTRKVFVPGTGVRNIAAALVVAEEDFRNPEVQVMLVTAALLALLVMIPLSLVWRKSRNLAAAYVSGRRNT